MRLVYNAGTATKVRGKSVAEDFQVSTQDTPLSIGGTPTTGNTIAGSDQITTNTVASMDNNFIVSAFAPLSATPPTISTDTPSIVTVSNSGRVTRIADGLAVIRVTNPYGTRLYSQQMVRVGGTTKVLTGYVAGSLAAHVSAAVDGMISGKLPNAATQNVFTASGTRSSTHIAAALTGLSAVSSYRASTGRQYPVTLISNRHFICAAHVQPAIGEVITWMDGAGNNYSASVSSKQLLGSYDICIGYLSAAINAAIVPASLLPSNYANYLPSQKYTGSNANIPAVIVSYNTGLTTDVLPTSEPHVRVTEVTEFTNNICVMAATPQFSSRQPFMSLPYAGDSGSPVFIPVNGVLVLLTKLYTALSGQSYADKLYDIDAVMTTLAGTAYSTTKVNLAGFTSF
jgi:hypothetical protein